MTQHQTPHAAVSYPADRSPATPAYPKARRIRFRFGETHPSDKYFIENDMMYSHFVAGLSAVFPPGEESFIRAVRRFSEMITDPELKKRVAGFIGQESVHGQEHRHLNEKLVELGYPIELAESEFVKDMLIRIENLVPAKLHLAGVAAAEHYTAVLAERVLSSEDVQAIPSDPEVRHLINWHALEELEHKSVAFDVLRAMGGTEPLRIAVMAGMLSATLPGAVLWLALSATLDPVARRQPFRVLRETYSLLRGPLLRGLMPELSQYLRPNFHPDDIDTSALLKRWQQELFGTEGTLVDHLKSSPTPQRTA
jgi:predicted metal-dependent hydrolase